MQQHVQYTTVSKINCFIGKEVTGLGPFLEQDEKQTIHRKKFNWQMGFTWSAQCSIKKYF